jgi:hypothetical protein
MGINFKSDRENSISILINIQKYPLYLKFELNLTYFLQNTLSYKTWRCLRQLVVCVVWPNHWFVSAINKHQDQWNMKNCNNVYLENILQWSISLNFVPILSWVAYNIQVPGWWNVVKQSVLAVRARCYPKWVIWYNKSPSFPANNQSAFCYNCITLTSIMRLEKGLMRRPQVSIVPGC